jgi:hypothetical protein
MVRSRLTGRVSLGKPPNFKTDAFDPLPPTERQVFRDKFAKALPHMRFEDDEDALDAALAEELLEKLHKAVDRALDLDEVSLDRIPSEDVKRYFDEAHRCYLYGFPVACAVLCRAILASALENLCDPRGTLQKRVPPGDSYFEALVRKASADGLLADDRPEWAIKVRDAGNDSIHNFRRFRECWLNSLDEILLNTRKVLLDLYTRSA